MKKIKIIRSEHASLNRAAELVEEGVNKFIEKELSTLSSVVDIKFTTGAKQNKCLVLAMIIYEDENKSRV